MLIENAAEFRTFSGKFRKFKIARGPEADEEDAFAVLWHHALRVDDFLVNAVAEFLGECAVDDFERAPFVVPQQVLHVFQHERGRLVMVQDGGDVERKSYLGRSILISWATVLNSGSPVMTGVSQCPWTLQTRLTYIETLCMFAT